MKTLLSIIFLFLTVVSKTQDKISIEGTWRMCKNYSDGIQINRNYCPEIIFKQDGFGYYEGNTTKFKWKMNDSIIDFNFSTNEERKLFFSPYSQFTVKVENIGKVQFLKLTNKKSNSWYLLGREQ